MDIITGLVEAVREVGGRLAERQATEPVPAVTVADALAAFAAVDGPAAGLLRERLHALRPRAAWWEDELTDAVPGDGEWWVCDAIDGAVQYLSGLPHWAVTATLLRDGEPVLAVVHAPLQRVTYTAAAGAGARLNGRPIAPPARALAAAVAATGQPPLLARDAVALRRAGESLSAVVPHVLAVRNLGPTALQVAQVGSGHLGLFWEYGSDVTNLLPGALIAREAGAAVTDPRGLPWTPCSDGFVAAAPSLHRELLDVLATVG
ncbi:inositol monophosphatase family protein [Kitasatospora sp. NPDC049258]|uniref:inositol monophosphatase family protein n=1 Tax=Kitasatospora sp. NPDC049258 TaxID=3155394 RepID=UPI0034395B2F